MLDFTFDATNTTLQCTFNGRMDSPASMEAAKEITSKLQGLSVETSPDKLKIIFDLATVDYIASAFMRICLQTAKTIQPGSFSVIRTNPFVMKIFMMTGLDKELNVS